MSLLMPDSPIRPSPRTLSDPRFYRGPKERQEFFERVMRETPPAQPAFFKRRPFFTRRKEAEPGGMK